MQRLQKIQARKFLLGAAALLCGLVAGHAQATLILTAGNNPGNTDNVVFNPCDNVNTGPALTVQGCLNTDHAQNVNFTGTENLVANGGQARIEAEVGTFDAFRINFADPSLGFTRLIFNPDADVDGFANFQAVDQFGNVFNFNNIPLDGQGNNFFTLSSADGQVAVVFRSFPQLPVNSTIWRRCAWHLRTSFPSLARWLCWVSVCSALPG